jgi:long-chain acyl-CoA synthetase
MAATLIDLVPVGPADRVISYLPLSHIAEQIVTVLTPPVAGHVVHYEPDIKRLAETIKEVRPTAFFAVPRVWERFYAGATAAIGEITGPRRAVANAALAVGRKYVDALSRGERPGGWLAARYRLFDRLVYSKAKEKMGLDQTRYMFSAAAPLSPAIPRFLAGLGMQILNLYGQSECTGLCSFSRPGRNRFGAVGTALPDNELRIAGDGEILTRGPNNFLGYLKDPQATAETLDADGFLHTGDVGHIDADGFLYITDRKKDIIITSGGKNISPQNLENSLMFCGYINQIAIIGDGRKYLAALIVPAFETLELWAKNNGISAASRSDLVKNEKVKALFEAQIKEYTKEYGQAEQIKKFTLLDKEWLQDTGELTPTLKLKRRVIIKKFSDVIDKMY